MCGNKNCKESIIYNYVMNMFLTMSNFIFPLVSFPYISRILEPEGMGQVAFATSIISYFVLISQMGIPKYGVRECAKVKNNSSLLEKTVQEIFVINCFMCIVSYIILGIALLSVQRLQESKIIIIVMSFTILFTTLGVEWFYQALEKYTYITLRSIVFKFIAMIVMFLLVRTKSDYIIYGGISILASSASGILNFLNLRKYINIKKRNKLVIKRHIKPILIFFAMTCATTIYLNMDVVMLGFMKTDAEVGYYNVAIKIKSVLVSVVVSLGTVLLPRATCYVQNGEMEKLHKVAQKAIQFVLFLTLPMIVFFSHVSKECILILAGNSYSNAELPMKILMPTILFIGLTNIMGIQVLVPSGKEFKVLISEVVGAIINLFFNIIFIPFYGAAGAAMGTLLAEIAVFVTQFLLYETVFFKIFKDISVWKNVISTVGAAMFAKLFTMFFMSGMKGTVLLLGYGFVFGVMYIGGLYLLKDSFIKNIKEILWRKL